MSYLQKATRKLINIIFFCLVHVHFVYDRKLDKKFCGCDLSKIVLSPFSETKGATDTYPTNYSILSKVFNEIKFNENDAFVDIGCGYGRVLAFLLMNQFPGKLCGIELNKEVADIPKKWAQKFTNIEILAGDAFCFDLSFYNYLCLSRPFKTPVFLRFLEKIEKEIHKPITFIYLFEQVDGHFLDERPGWKLLKREEVFYLKTFDWLPISFPIYVCPQRYSIWKFDPEEKKYYDGPLYKDVSHSNDFSILNDINVDIAYCKKYDVIFDRTITGKLFWYPGKNINHFDSSNCMIQNNSSEK